MVGDTIYGLQYSMGRPSKSPAEAFYCVSLALPREAELRILRIGRFLEGRGMRANPAPPGVVLMRCAECPSPPVTGLLPRCGAPPRFHGRLEIVEPALPEAALPAEGRPAPPPNHRRSPDHGLAPAHPSDPPGAPDHPPAPRPWAVLPVDLDPWYAELRSALLARGPSPPALSRMGEFPPCGPFIPLACFQGGPKGPGESSRSGQSGQSSQSGESADLFTHDLFAHEELQSILDETEKGGWRAMNLVCRRIDTAAGRPWYMAAYWRTEWTRRLRRAPESNKR